MRVHLGVVSLLAVVGACGQGTAEQSGGQKERLEVGTIAGGAPLCQRNTSRAVHDETTNFCQVSGFRVTRPCRVGPHACLAQGCTPVSRLHGGQYPLGCTRRVVRSQHPAESRGNSSGIRAVQQQLCAKHSSATPVQVRGSHLCVMDGCTVRASFGVPGQSPVRCRSVPPLRSTQMSAECCVLLLRAEAAR